MLALSGLEAQAIQFPRRRHGQTSSGDTLVCLVEHASGAYYHQIMACQLSQADLYAS